ncbi:MAG TPA: F0F1 ATP synthase subunit delta [Candidatus Saccharimonadales bacterium]|nr:F0F1 ATP synthase subunit delta [Candidatus Saccharimonadales bacterium]HSW96641.1 F0F1 ATP synthase subunit delta [Candidatus Saccharimonadales bacterium]
MEQLDFSDFFSTKSQANDFCTRLAAVAEQVYQTNFNLEKTLMDQFSLQKKDAIITFLRNNNISVESNSGLKNFLTSMQEKITALPVLSLTVAFEPKEQTLKTISEWFMLNMHQQVVFIITVDPTILAGAVISFNGKFSDVSIKSTFNRILKETLDNVLSPNPIEKKTIQLVAGHQSIDHITFGR